MLVCLTMRAFCLRASPARPVEQVVCRTVLDKVRAVEHRASARAHVSSHEYERNLSSRIVVTFTFSRYVIIGAVTTVLL